MFGHLVLPPSQLLSIGENHQRHVEIWGNFSGANKFVGVYDYIFLQTKKKNYPHQINFHKLFIM